MSEVPSTKRKSETNEHQTGGRGKVVNFKDIEKIVKLMDTHGLSQFKLQQEDTKLELKKGSDIDIEAVQRLMAASAQAPVHLAHPASPVAQAAQSAGSSSEQSGRPDGIEEVLAPMVGTFYSAASPEDDPFVKTGDKVKEDSTVCIIEAMKVFNEITAEIKGEIIEILVENGAPVQYHEPLFLVKTS